MIPHMPNIAEPAVSRSEPVTPVGAHVCVINGEPVIFSDAAGIGTGTLVSSSGDERLALRMIGPSQPLQGRHGLLMQLDVDSAQGLVDSLQRIIDRLRAAAADQAAAALTRAAGRSAKP